MGYTVLRREWRSMKAMWIVMLAELACTVALLVLFGIAQPDLYRTQLWRAGNDLGFNSSPNILLYAYANHVPLPTIPFVWSSTLTNFNVAISVISLFVLIAKTIGVIMHVWFPVIALFFNVALTALYTTSVYGQMGPDHADPNHPSPIAWYIAKPCTVAANQSVQKSCRTAQGTYAATVIFLAVYVVNLGLNIWTMLPTEADKSGKDVDTDEESNSSSSGRRNDKWEMHGIPPTPRTATMPFTPRTMAFNTLDRKMPTRTTERELPFRSQYS
ncbi:hypothetical protein BKA67DRAFT_200731 [Truncatella angustata]|uniref:Uncharacterized protein n=1 Tax=Truncatella angustata TaxID=152316 RepID=A0A9P8UT41_9PEZI|nr:uncharacterized protein BKA67DRAFT_200731 [Truncatella angustata]KAH6657853.1 hypothetical protein BKA67DRAFT_200731 [Truncatella angustata]KAH8197103.1 hypothetical protein TruAng_008742 [Truncatella angustata]